MSRTTLPPRKVAFIYLIRVVIVAYCFLMVALESVGLLVQTVRIMWQMYEPLLCALVFLLAGLIHLIELARYHNDRCCRSCCMSCLSAAKRNKVANDSPKTIEPEGMLEKALYHISNEDAPCGRKGVYYNLKLNLLELYEIPSQTYLTYEISRVSSNWTAIFMSAITVIVSCCGFLTIHFTSIKRHRMHYASNVLSLDIVCDVLVAMGIPVGCLMVPLVSLLSDAEQRNNLALTNEFQAAGKIATISSPLDLFLRVYPLHYILKALKKIEKNWMELALDDTPHEATELNDTLVRFSKFQKWVLLPLVGVWGLAISTATIITAIVPHCGSYPLNDYCLVKSYPLAFDTQPCSCISLSYHCEDGNWSNDQHWAFLDAYGSSHHSNNLVMFAIAKCQLQSLPSSIVNAPQVEFIILVAMEVNSFEFEDDENRKLLVLGMYGVKMVDYPSRLPRSVMWVDLYGNNLSDNIPFLQQEVQLPLLNWLSLTDNPELTMIPPAVFSATHLEVLILRNNSIQVLPPEISQLKQLRALVLISNKIKVIPNDLTTLSTLREIGLDWNLINAVPWTREMLVEKNQNPAGIKAGNFLYRYFSLSANPICGKEHEFQIHDLIACQVPCSIGCTRFDLDLAGCNPFCNNSACNFSNGDCLN